MSYTPWMFDQASCGSVNGEKSILEPLFWPGFEENGDFPATMSPALPPASREPIPVLSSFRNPPLTQSSSESGNSGWAHPSVLHHAERHSKSFPPDRSLQSGFNNIDYSPLIPRSFNTSDTQGYFNSYEPCYAQSIVSSPGPFYPQPYPSMNVQASQSILPPAGWPCTSSTGLAGVGPQTCADQVSEPPSRMNPYPRKHLSGSSVDAGDEVMLVCCGHRFSSKPSFDRHRKDSCKTFPTGGKRFQCDPRIHCQKTFRRRCGLKKRLEKVGLSEERVDEVVRQKYGKGMRRRPD